MKERELWREKNAESIKMNKERVNGGIGRAWNDDSAKDAKGMEHRGRWRENWRRDYGRRNECILMDQRSDGRIWVD